MIWAVGRLGLGEVFLPALDAGADYGTNELGLGGDALFGGDEHAGIGVEAGVGYEQGLGITPFGLGDERLAEDVALLGEIFVCEELGHIARIGDDRDAFKWGISSADSARRPGVATGPR